MPNAILTGKILKIWLWLGSKRLKERDICKYVCLSRSRSAPQQQQTTITNLCLPEVSEEPWKGSNFCLLAFGGPSTKWSAMVKSRCYLLFTKPKPKHWPNATANRSHCTVIHYLPRFMRQTHGLYRKIRHKWYQTVDVPSVRESMHLSRHIFIEQ